VSNFSSAVEHLETGNHQYIMEGFDSASKKSHKTNMPNVRDIKHKTNMPNVRDIKHMKNMLNVRDIKHKLDNKRDKALNTKMTSELKPGYSLKCRPATISDPKTQTVVLNDNYMYKMDESRTLFTVSSWVSIIFIIVFLCVVVPGIYSMSTDEGSLDYKFLFLFVITFVSSLLMFINKKAMFVGLIGLVISIVSFGIWYVYRKLISTSKLNLSPSILAEIGKSIFNADFLSGKPSVRIPMLLGAVFTIICIILFSTIHKQLSKSAASIGFILFGMISGIIFYSLVIIFSVIKMFGGTSALTSMMSKMNSAVSSTSASSSMSKTTQISLLVLGAIGIVSIILSSIAISKKKIPKPNKPKKPKKLSTKNLIIAIVVPIGSVAIIGGLAYFFTKSRSTP
jgi:hypothetical protein